MNEQEFAAGHVFFQPGDTGDRAYFIQDGSVEVLAGDAEPYTRIGLFQPGDVFGEMALIEERPRAFTARAVTAGRVLPMSRDVFEHHLLHEPARARQYLRSLFERLRSLTAEFGTAAEFDPKESAPPAQDGQQSARSEYPVTRGLPGKWTVVIHSLTHKAAETLPEDGLLVTRFPLRIGRAAAAQERDALDLNDLWLLDNAPYNISRNHCEIYLTAHGPTVRDRGSQLGCIVNEKRIGATEVMGYARLEDGDNVLIIGSRMSPYQFRVAVSDA
jgi:hypothetical protein